jgi:hypothetical protein
VLLAYAKAYFGAQSALDEFVDGKHFADSEDLGDFAEAMRTILTFGPNPRSFRPTPIYPTRSEADYMGYPEAAVVSETGEEDKWVRD